MTVLDPPAIVSGGNPLPAAGGADPNHRTGPPRSRRIPCSGRAVTGAVMPLWRRRSGFQNAAATFAGPEAGARSRQRRSSGSEGARLRMPGPAPVPRTVSDGGTGARSGYAQVRVARDRDDDLRQAGLLPRGRRGRGALRVLSSGLLPDESRGVFHPDNFSFGQPVFLSPIYAAVQAIDGVASVDITKFQRQGQTSHSARRRPARLGAP